MNRFVHDDLGPLSWRDGLTLLTGEKLGAGGSREVYACAIDDTLVVKLEHPNERWPYQNAQEWAIWHRVQDQPALARWFAPCVHTSYAGLWLLQRRTTPVTLAELRAQLPKVPAFFGDTKVSNWGRLGRRIVCHDYGVGLTTERGLTTRLRRATWWEEE